MRHVDECMPVHAIQNYVRNCIACQLRLALLLMLSCWVFASAPRKNGKKSFLYLFTIKKQKTQKREDQKEGKQSKSDLEFRLFNEL